MDEEQQPRRQCSLSTGAGAARAPLRRRLTPGSRPRGRSSGGSRDARLHGVGALCGRRASATFPSSGARDLPTHSRNPTASRASLLARLGTAAVLGDGLSSEQAGGVDAVDEPDPPGRSARPRKRARSSATARRGPGAGGRSMSHRLGAAGAAAPGGRPSVSAGAVRGKCIDRRPQALVVKAAGRAAA
jgi:hypothetical protein